jgi:UDPglucose 6-dehydrogenase
MDEDYVPQDFEYGYLINAVRELANAARELSKNIAIVVVSTVLPGTMDKHIRPLLNVHTKLVYHPFFIAMGTVIDDFTNPEFVLLGIDTPGDEHVVLDLYKDMHNAPASVISVASAELTKVAYNTFITMKIVFANTMAEMAEHTGADVDQVTESLAMGSQRIISPAYLTAGMGDGGACHPRDNIAMSALAAKHSMSVDLMGYLISARQYHVGWQASIIAKWHDLTGLEITILGKAYKPGVNSTAGSPALLLSAMLNQARIKHIHSDYEVDATGSPVYSAFKPRIFFIATKHSGYSYIDCPVGSVVIDPFGFVTVPAGVTLVTPGRK